MFLSLLFNAIDLGLRQCICGKDAKSSAPRILFFVFFCALDGMDSTYFSFVSLGPNIRHTIIPARSRKARSEYDGGKAKDVAARTLKNYSEFSVCAQMIR